MRPAPFIFNSQNKPEKCEANEDIAEEEVNLDEKDTNEFEGLEAQNDRPELASSNSIHSLAGNVNIPFSKNIRVSNFS